MWRKAQSTPQKLAVLDGLLPITADEYLKAVVAFCGDSDEKVWKAASEKLRNYSTPDIRKNITAEINDNSILALARLAGDRKDSSLIISLLHTGKLKPEWILTYASLTDVEFWRTLITHKDFILFALPKKDEFVQFFNKFSSVIADLFIEHGTYLTKEEIESVMPTQKESGSGEEIEEAKAEGDEDVVLLGNENFDFPDFLLSDEVFEGLSADDIADKRKNITQMLKNMTMGQRIKVAMMGNLEVRKILIKDPRKQISLSVLTNPRITEKEVIAVAGDAAASLDLISHIINIKSLSKSYQVKLALVMNPKTPVKVSMSLLDVIRMNDLKKIAKSRNIPSVLKMKAAKRIV